MYNAVIEMGPISNFLNRSLISEKEPAPHTYTWLNHICMEKIKSSNRYFYGMFVEA